MNEKEVYVSARIRQIGKYYYLLYRYTPEKGQERKEICRPTHLLATPENRKAAIKMMHELYSEIYEQVNDDNLLLSGNLPVFKYMQKWIRELQTKNDLEKNTIDSYERNVRNYIVPYFSDHKSVTLNTIKVRHIEDFFNYLIEKELSPNTVKRINTCLSKAFTDAMRMEVMTRNPAQLAKLPKRSKYVALTLNKEQLMKLFREVEGTPLEIPVILAGCMGLRRSEIAGLFWEDVDFDKNTIWIRRTMVPLAGKGRYLKPRTKNESSNRIIAMPKLVAEKLILEKEKQKRNKKEFGNCYFSKVDGINNDFVCRWENGKPIGYNYFSTALQKYLKRANLPDIRFHDLRHSCATILNDNGASLREISDLLGHSSIQTTSSIYVHFTNKASQDTANLLDDILDHVEKTC